MLAELQGDRGADHYGLPFERDGEAAHPVAPVVCGLVEHRRQRMADIAAERLVRSQEEMERLFDPEGARLQYVADRRVGSEPPRLRPQEETGRASCRESEWQYV